MNLLKMVKKKTNPDLLKEQNIEITREKWNGQYYNVARKNGKFYNRQKWSRKNNKSKFISKQVRPKVEEYVKNVVYDKNLTHFRKQVRKNVLKDSEAYGQIVLRIKFYRGKVSIITKGYSYSGPLNNAKFRREMDKEAFNMAFSKCPFSPDGFRVISRRYIYYFSRNK